MLSCYLLIEFKLKTMSVLKPKNGSKIHIGQCMRKIFGKSFRNDVLLEILFKFKGGNGISKGQVVLLQRPLSRTSFSPNPNS